MKKITKMIESLNFPSGVMAGNVVEVSTRCGNANCKCMRDKNPEKHKFNQLSYSNAGKTKTLYIKRKDLPLVTELTNNYKSMRKASLALGDEFVKLVKEKGINEASKVFKKSFSKANSHNKENKKLEKDLKVAQKSLGKLKGKSKNQSNQLNSLNRKLADIKESRDNWKEKSNISRDKMEAIVIEKKQLEKNNKKISRSDRN
jgi:hypothetical protein